MARSKARASGSANKVSGRRKRALIPRAPSSRTKSRGQVAVATNAAKSSRRRGVLLLSGFEPFGGEHSNPSWEVAALLDGREVGGLVVRAVRLPVNTPRAVRAMAAAIRRTRPRAVLGLGQAGGRPAISLEKIAINLAERRAARESDGGVGGAPVIRGGPDAYFTRLPVRAILRSLERRAIPATLSLSAGAYVCNSVMYTTLHTLRARREIPAGFIHLPYAARQAIRHRHAPSMTLEMMAAAVEATAAAIARDLSLAPDGEQAAMAARRCDIPPRRLRDPI